MLDNYTLEVIKLVKSMQIKWHKMGVHMNLSYDRNIATLKKYDLYDLTTWKYYVNLTGEYHEIDNIILGPDGIQVRSLDTGEDFKLTKENLLQHPLTNNYIRSSEDYLRTLIHKYPKHTLLIRGILDPVDMDVAIHSKDGTILTYDTSLVEKQEHNLIPTLQQYIENFIARWHIDEYIVTDELYIPMFYSSLTTMLVTGILNIRLRNIGTDRVHSYHMREHFKSNRNTDFILEVLTDELKLWLYKNLNGMVKFTGRVETLDKIVNNVIRASGIEVYELQIKDKDVIKDQRAIDREEGFELNPYFTRDENRLFWTKYGTTYDGIDNASIDVVLEREINEVSFTAEAYLDVQESIIRNIKQKLKESTLNDARTKVLKLEANQLSQIEAIDTKDVILDNFIYKMFMAPNNEKVVFKDVQTMTDYELTYKQALLVLIDTMTLHYPSLHKKKFHSITLFNVVDNKTVDELLPGLLLQDRVRPLLENLLTYKPDVTKASNTGKYKDDVKLFIDDTVFFFRKLWYIMSNNDSGTVDGMFRLIYDRLTSPVTFDLFSEDKTINDALLEEGIIMKRDYDYDINVFLRDFFLTFTGIYINEEDKLAKIIEAFKKFIDRMSSYTIQVLTNTSTSLDIMPYVTPNAINGLNLAKVVSSNFQCLEEINADLQLKLIDVKDRLMVIDRPNLHYTFTDPNVTITARPIVTNTLRVIKPGLNATVIEHE